MNRYHLPELVLLLSRLVGPFLDPFAADAPRFYCRFCGAVSWLMMRAFWLTRDPYTLGRYYFPRLFAERFERRRSDLFEEIARTGRIT